MVDDVVAAVAGVRMACCLRVVRTDADAVCRSFVKERGSRVRVVLIVDSFGAVVVVGVPYPPLHDAAVRLKRAHERAAGDRWYTTEAFTQATPAAVGEGCT